MMHPVRKIVLQFLGRSNIELPHNLAIPFLGIYTRLMKTYVLKRMVMAVLVIIAQKWEQPKCSLTDECMNKMWYHLCDEILLGSKNK